MISNHNITPGLGKEWAWSPSWLFWPPWAKRPGSWVFQLWSVDYVLSSITYISSFTSLSFTPILPFLKGHFQVLYRLHQHRDILSKEGGRTGLKYLSIVSILIITSQLWVFLFSPLNCEYSDYHLSIVSVLSIMNNDSWLWVFWFSPLSSKSIINVKAGLWRDSMLDLKSKVTCKMKF